MSGTGRLVCARICISVCILFCSDRLPLLLPLSLCQCPCSPFFCLYHFIFCSYHQHRLLLSVGLRVQSDPVCSSLLPPTVSWVCELVCGWLIKCFCVLRAVGVHLVNLHVFGCNDTSSLVCLWILLFESLGEVPPCAQSALWTNPISLTGWCAFEFHNARLCKLKSHTQPQHTNCTWWFEAAIMKNENLLWKLTW